MQVGVAERGRSWKVVLLAVPVLAVAIGASLWLFRPVPGTTPSAESEGRQSPADGQARAVSALGEIQPFGGIVNVGIPLPDRVEQIEEGAAVGKVVKQGDPLIRLESYTDRQLELQLLTRQIEDARARLGAARRSGEAQIELEKRRLEQLKELAPLEKSLQDQKIKLLTRQRNQAKENLQRLESLQDMTVSRQEIEQQRLLADQAETELQAARAQLEKLALSQVMNQKLCLANLQAAEAALAKAEAEISLPTLEEQRKLAERRFERALIRAPQAGTILKVYVRPGELVGGQAPILQMADTSRMAVMAEVYETDVRHVAPCQAARIKGPALAQELTGKVVQIGQVVGKNRVTPLDPTAAVDRRIVEVKIELDNPELAAAVINHQVLVTILPESGGAGRP